VPEEITILLREVHDEINGLRDDVRALSDVLGKKASKFWTRTVGVLLAAAIIALGVTATVSYQAAERAKSAATIAKRAVDATTDLGRRQAAQLMCITVWASQFTDRARVLTAASQARNDANDDLTHALNALFRAAISKEQARIPGLVKAWLTAATAFDKASAAYQRALAAHPVPPLVQQLDCGNK
jgi:hypothetical protein